MPITPLRAPSAGKDWRGLEEFHLKATILLVEDSKLQKIKNESLLHKAGYRVLHASDGEEALRVARESAPDLILLDMLLPKLGGKCCGR